jgi:uncharacterized protein YggU (UPF0235/DUF167 family)
VISFALPVSTRLAEVIEPQGATGAATIGMQTSCRSENANDHHHFHIFAEAFRKAKSEHAADSQGAIMITRGYYIGEIIDELSAIAAQVSMRNKLGMTDLSVFAENFFRDLLNKVHAISLVNLNTERSNAPGLDLGDEASGLAIQVTATATAQKVNDTLASILPEHQGKYRRFVVLVIGKKQRTYAVNKDSAKRLRFSKKSDIWDLETIARDVVSLEIMQLQKVHQQVRSEVAKLKVELEIPDSNGKYPTSGYDLWEKRVKPKIGNGAEFRKFVADINGVSEDEVDPLLTKEIQNLARQLSRLPRITREFLVMLITRRESRKSRRFSEPWMTLLLDKVKREFHGADLDGELRILDDAGFVDIRCEDIHEDGPAEIGVRIPSKCDDLSHCFLGFLDSKGLKLRNVIGEVDLSSF